MEIKVAIFDDSDALRNSLEFLINGTPGFTVTGTFVDCNNLLADVQTSLPDVVLMDIDMPGIDGIEATAIIKANHPAINVLILTSFDDSNKVFNAICSGASGYLLKKTSPAKILEAIIDVNQGGSAMNANIARKVLDFFIEKKNIVTKDYDLSPRELDILRCLVKGDSYKMIAEQCFISMGTVCTHINNIYKKLHVNSKSEAVAKAIREHLVGEHQSGSFL